MAQQTLESKTEQHKERKAFLSDYTSAVYRYLRSHVSEFFVQSGKSDDYRSILKEVIDSRIQDEHRAYYESRKRPIA